MEDVPVSDAPQVAAAAAPDTTAKRVDHKVALTPPTSEDMDRGKREVSSSDLSELAFDDEEDIGEVEPAYYWDGGKIPVFHPTMAQFRSFKKFVDKIDKYGMKSGIVKVVPPAEWRNSLPDLSEAVKKIKVKNPIMQDFSGSRGQYTQQNIEKQRSYNLPQWKALTEEWDHQPPAKRGERRGDQTAPARTRSTRNRENTNAAPAPKRARGRPRKSAAKEDASREETQEPEQAPENGLTSRRNSQQSIPPTPASPPDDSVGPVDKKIAALKKEAPEDSTPKPRGRQPKSISSRRKNNSRADADDVDEEAFVGFDYHMQGLDEFTKERCAELEQYYWKTVNFGQPMYGADMPGSLFDEATTSWNVAKLENLLDVLGTKVPGVNTAYLYLGMWKATFAWHLEDVDLYSINYIHFGAPKQWYSISQEDARRFENAMKRIWPNDAKNCSQFLRHKTYLISPQRLESEFNIKVNKLIHYEGEFVLTYPYGYHSGYNIGYNCAESVNFATEQWLEYGRIAKKCDCESDSVWVDVAEIERKLRGEPTPEYIEETDEEDEDDEMEIAHDLPSPPASVKGKSAPRKRKRDTGAKDAQEKVKRVKIRIKIPKAEPCVLCPNDVAYDTLLPTDNGKQAHRLCALFTPETFIVEEDGVERVCNVSNIDKARLELKCNYCRSKRGSCFQCASKKCTRAFHATCAAPAGVQIDEGPVPTFDEDGTEYFCDGFDLRCRFHRAKRPKNADVDNLEESKLIKEYAKDLKPNQVLQAQYLVGEVFAGLVVENRPSELSVVVDVLPDCRERIELEWKYILVLDPKHSLRPKPSANAKPLPEGLQSSNPALNSKNQKDGPPEVDDPFTDQNSSQKWAEFNTASAEEVKNPFQVKVDLSKPNQLWYYLGKTSTEARAQFTDDPKKPVHNTRGNFLDTVKEAQRAAAAAERKALAGTYPSANVNALNGAMAAQRKSLQPQYTPRTKQYTPRTTEYTPRTTEYTPRTTGYTPRNSVDLKVLPRPPYSTGYSPASHAPPAPAARPSSSPFGNPNGMNGPATFTPLPPYPYTHSAHSPEARRNSTATSYSQSSQPGYKSSEPFVPAYHQPASPSPYSTSSDAQNGRRVPYPNVHRPSFSQQHSPGSVSSAGVYKTDSPVLTAQRQSSSSSGQADVEYLQFLQRFPYLRNAYLRRPKVYESPYPGTSGFSDAYDPRKLRTQASQPQSNVYSQTLQNWGRPSLPQPNNLYNNSGHGLGAYSSNGANSTASASRPGLTFQSAQDFQADVNRAHVPPANGSSKFELLIKQLSQANENAARRYAAQTQSQQHIQPRPPQPGMYYAQPYQQPAQTRGPPPQPHMQHYPPPPPQPQQPLQTHHPHQPQPQPPYRQHQSNASRPTGSDLRSPPPNMSLGGYTGPSNTRGYRPGYGYDSGAFGPATQTKVPEAFSRPPAPMTPGRSSVGEAVAGGAVPGQLTPQRPAVSPLSEIGDDDEDDAPAPRHLAETPVRVPQPPPPPTAVAGADGGGSGSGRETWRFS
ncbi:hypothetical protein IWZ03DRAFT_341014 [Phyllosticta citriasiana]|uniref:[histone H3]-trimethyl-L-lysine(9) demethylase n=1 Tax=Phyllosticta citriasiana TaxID=595635 RepID=A0ABR1L5J2_9PEZI